MEIVNQSVFIPTLVSKVSTIIRITFPMVLFPGSQNQGSDFSKVGMNEMARGKLKRSVQDSFRYEMYQKVALKKNRFSDSH